MKICIQVKIIIELSNKQYVDINLSAQHAAAADLAKAQRENAGVQF
jgi:hypothetical protein